MADLLKLKVKDLKRKKRILILEGKTKKARTIQLNKIYSEIQEYIKNLDSEWLFPSRKGEKPITVVQAYRQLNKTAEMADITEGIGIYTMRKTFGYLH